MTVELSKETHMQDASPETTTNESTPPSPAAKAERAAAAAVANYLLSVRAR